MQLMSQLEAQALMTEPGPSSPQGSAGSPGTPQNISQPSRDFLRADVTPLEDMTPLNANPACVIISQSSPSHALLRLLQLSNFQGPAQILQDAMHAILAIYSRV